MPPRPCLPLPQVRSRYSLMEVLKQMRAEVEEAAAAAAAAEESEG